LGLQPSKMLEVVANRDVWRLNLELLPPQFSRTWAGSERRRRFHCDGRWDDWCYTFLCYMFFTFLLF